MVFYRVQGALNRGDQPWFLAAGFTALFIASVATHHSWIPAVHRGIALDRWYEFFTGVVAWWAVSGVVPMMTLPAVWAINALGSRHPDSLIEIVLLVSVSSLCLVSAKSPAFERPSMQFSQRITLPTRVGTPVGVTEPIAMPAP